jgi:hypothetical protein
MRAPFAQSPACDPRKPPPRRTLSDVSLQGYDSGNFHIRSSARPILIDHAINSDQAARVIDRRTAIRRLAIGTNGAIGAIGAIGGVVALSDTPFAPGAEERPSTRCNETQARSAAGDWT